MNLIIRKNRQNRTFVPLARSVRVQTLFAIAIFGLILLGASITKGEDLLTESALKKALGVPANFTWKNGSLQGAVKSLGRKRIPVFLDRKVDPSMVIDSQSQWAPLELLIDELCKSLDLEVYYGSDFVYIGPRATVERLPVLLQVHKSRVKKMDSAVRKKIIKRLPVAWDRASEPSKILNATLAKYGLALVGDKELPYDLWAEGELAESSFVTHATLLLAGFDLTFSVNPKNGQVRIIDVPLGVAFPVTYSSRLSPAAIKAKITSKFPNAEIKPGKNEIVVKAKMADHVQIAKILMTRSKPKGSKNYSTKVEDQRFTLNLKAAAGSIVKKISQNLGLEMKITSQEVKTLLGTEVKVEVVEASAQKILDETVRSLGLKATISRDAITISK